MSEVCFKIAPGDPENDGRVIAILPDGWLIPSLDMYAWLKVDAVLGEALAKEPAILAEMPRYMADRCRRRVLAVRWKLARTAEEIEKEYALPAGAGQHEKDMATEDLAKFVENGLDTTWGTEDLKVHAVVRVPDLTAHEQAEYLDKPRSVDHLGKPLAVGKSKGRYKVDYAAVLSAAKVAAMRDPAVRVDVDRASAPLAKSVIVSITATVN
jgi:hypothetical protein